MSHLSTPSSLSIHLHISATSVMSNKTHTVKRPQTLTYTLTKDQHGHFLHVPPTNRSHQGCNEAYKAWWGPWRPWDIGKPPSHNNLFVTGYRRIYERGEGGKGGGEVGGAQKVEPKDWKVIFLAEILVGVLSAMGPESRQPSSCVVLDLISFKPPSYTTDAHKAQLPTYEQ